MLKFLSKDEIEKINDRQFEDVEVPEWKSMVRVKGLTSVERDEFEDSRRVGKGKKERMNLVNFRAAFLVRAIVDQDFKRLWDDKGATVLGRKSALVLSRLFNIATRLSGMTDEDVEEMESNLENEGGEDSSST